MRYVFCLAWILFLTASNASATAGNAEIEQKIQWFVEAEDSQPFSDTPETRQFYKQSYFKPAWVTETGWSNQAWQLVEVLRAADTHGLDPEDYAVSTIIRDLGHLTPSAHYLASLDIRLTTAYITYARHMLRGKVIPANMPQNWEVDLRYRNLANLLKSALANKNIAQSLQTLVPPHADYEQLRTALKQYRDIRIDGNFLRVPPGRLLRHRDIDSRTTILRQRLVSSGDLAPRTGDNSKLFDKTLEQALRRFQHRHGIEVDGILGPKTLQALNVPLASRIRQIELNLERLRWLPEDLGDPHVRINIPAYELGVIKNNNRVLSMRAIVGERYHQTPIFTRDMTYIVFNPYWHIPASIAVDEMLPKIKNDLDYLKRENIRVYAGWNENERTVDPSEINWSLYSPEVFPFHLRQQPGSHNALGLVKFMLPNPYAIYLHDTPARQLFAKPVRSFSHGCIRLEKPFVLAQYLLKDLPNWDEEHRTQITSSGVETEIRLPKPIPVHLMYLTAWADSSGTAYFRDDVYERDAELARILGYQ